MHAETIYKLCIVLQISPKNLFDFPLENESNENKEFINLSKKIYDTATTPEKLDFINIAIDSLCNKSAREKLKLIIKGIDLSE